MIESLMDLLGLTEVPQSIITGIEVLAILLCAQIGTWVVTRTVKECASRVLNGVAARVTFMAPILIWLVSVVAILWVLGVNPSSITEILIAGGLVIGLVITPAGSNVIAGILNIWGDVYRVGEVLEIEDKVGRVIKRGLISTRLETIDNSLYDVPNKVLFDAIVHNFNRVEFFRVIVKIHIDDPHFDLLETEAVLKDVVENNPVWNQSDTDTGEEFTAEIRFHEIAPSSYVFLVIVWIQDRLNAPKQHDNVLRACALALTDAKISFGQTTNLSATGGLNILANTTTNDANGSLLVTQS